MQGSPSFGGDGGSSSLYAKASHGESANSEPKEILAVVLLPFLFSRLL